MKIDLDKNWLSVKILYHDKEKIKKLGFTWDKKTKTWNKDNANQLTSLELSYIQELEKRFFSHESRRHEDYNDMLMCMAEIESAGDR